MRHLFSPFQLKNVVFKNRIVMPALASFLIGEDGNVSAATVEHYRRRASGGPAMIIMEACTVSPEGSVSTHQARIDDDRFVKELSKIADALKAEGCIPAAQIHHGGRQISPKVIGKRKALAPSPLPCPSIGAEVEPLTIDGIQRLVSKFADAAVRAQQAGFELIEIHGAHGYLINQFLSKFSNIRSDQYGGDTRGRARFAEEIVREIRHRLGPDFPISFKISAQEFVPGGLNVDESIEIMKILVAAGVDVVQVSAGNDATSEWICQPMFMPPACLADSAARFKAALDIPVMAVGRINEARVGEMIIAENKADLVCVGRGLLADPEMPNKAKAGKFDDIRVCIACNTCMASIFRLGRIECLVNPVLGHEEEMALHPASKPRKVMVVGGGPAGLSIAATAASRGHIVELYEKASDLGGQLIPGSSTHYKKGLQQLIDFQTNQIKKHGVTCQLNCEITADDIKKKAPDVVILATGSIPARPNIPGADKKNVVTFLEILNGQPSGPARYVVIGGGPTGCEVAHHLAEQGNDVAIVEMRPKLGIGLEAMTKRILFRKLKECGVEVILDATIVSIEDSGVQVVDADGNQKFVAADQIVLAAGIKPDNTLFEALADYPGEVHRIGDCLEPRNAKEALYDSAVLGRTI